jgi:membrane protein implicated in regulation of membrane protease activity
MGFDIVFWHWLVLGMGLMLLEMLLPSFIALWFGVAGLLVGIVLWTFPSLPEPAQIILWAITSCLLTWLWFKYLKPLSTDKTLAGLSREAMIGQIGQVLSLPVEHKRGMLRFPAPVLGSDEWLFISQDTLAIGDRVRVTDISGNSLIVVKH